jgi:hypothetical protein
VSRTELTEAEVIDAIDGFLAYELGCTDSGIHDDALQDRVAEWIEADVKRANATLCRMINRWTTDKRIASGYTLADVKELMDWIDRSYDLYSLKVR